MRFIGPVIAGRRIRGRFTLIDAQPVSGGMQLAWDVVVESEHEARPVMVAEWLTRVLTS